MFIVTEIADLTRIYMPMLLLAVQGNSMLYTMLCPLPTGSTTVSIFNNSRAGDAPSGPWSLFLLLSHAPPIDVAADHTPA
jgi:hypothetical protein